MNTDGCVALNDTKYSVCKSIFKLLKCNVLWMMKFCNNTVSIAVTDRSIWDHYVNKKYYLQDPTIINAVERNQTGSDPKSVWTIKLGTECDDFQKSGFLYDLYKMFHVEEFASIEKTIGADRYCFRFFTLNNRFVFMNNLLNNMAIVQYSINVMVANSILEMSEQFSFSLTDLQ